MFTVSHPWMQINIHVSVIISSFFLSPTRGEPRWRLFHGRLLIIKCFAAPPTPHPAVPFHTSAGVLNEAGNWKTETESATKLTEDEPPTTITPSAIQMASASLYGQLRIPALSNVLWRRRRCSYPLVIFTRAAQWLLNSQVLKDTPSVCCGGAGSVPP